MKSVLSSFFFYSVIFPCYRVLVVDPEGESGGTPYRFPVNVVAEDVDVGELLGHVDGTLVSMRKPSFSGLPYSHSPDVSPINCFRKVCASLLLYLQILNQFTFLLYLMTPFFV